mgnify:FL=1
MEPKGFIAVCKNDTEQECFDRMLFGSLRSWWDKVQQVQKGDVGFLLNLDEDILSGPFRAESNGTLNIVPEAWGGRFPAQVRVSREKGGASILNARQMLREFGIAYTKYVLTAEETASLRAMFGSPEDVEMFGIFRGVEAPQERRFKTEDGHYVRSKAECIIDNWLYHHDVVHAYERVLPIEPELRCDFYVKAGDCYIEYWGLQEDEEYRSRRDKKVVTYQKHHLKLIGLNDKDIELLDDVLPKKLLRYLPKDYKLR